MDDLHSKIKSLPKADLHNHLTLGLSKDSLRKNYPDCRLKSKNRFWGLNGMHRYIHNELNRIMKTGEDVIRFMEISINDSIEDGVILLEASIDIGLSRYFKEEIEPLIEAAGMLQKKYRGKISFRPDIGVKKDFPLEKARFYIDKCIRSAVFSGIDLYGTEKDMDLDGFLKIFRSARENGLKTKVHIGEFSGPETIEESIHLLEPDEIQHGIKAARSKKTMDLILEKGIRLNVCPQSNISLGSEWSLKSHPIRKLYDYGIDITINTDDRVLFDASLTDQFIRLIKEKIFSFEEIDQIRRNALNQKTNQEILNFLK